MSSIPQNYIDAIQRIVKSFLNQVEDIRAFHIHHNRMLEGSYNQSIEMDSAGNVIIECQSGGYVGIREKT